MNPYLVLLLILMVGGSLFDLWVNRLNICSSKVEVPGEFRDVYDPAKYAKAQSYLRENVQFDDFRKIIFTAIGLGFILLGGFNWADQLARNFGFGTITTGLIFVGLLSALRTLVSMPFNLYDTFVIEEKYGFNKTTLKTYILDAVKGAVLGIILGAPIFAGLIYFFKKAGDQAWLYAWLVVTAFQLIVTFLAPVLIMPLFNKFDPIPEGELKTSIENFARSQNFELQGIFTMDGSKRSTKANAFFTGFGKFRRLVLFDTLMEKHTQPELVAVLAHEIGHYKLKHIPQFMIISVLTSGLLFYTLSFFVENPELFAAFQMEQTSVYASLVLATFFYSPILKVLSIFTLILSRKFEFEADEYSARTYGKSEDLVTALKKLSAENLSNLTPHPLKVFLEYSHPPVLDRISALRKR